MKNQIRTIEVKKMLANAAQLKDDAIDLEVKTFLTEYKTDSSAIKKQLKEFENNAYDTKKYNIHFGEDGMLGSEMELNFSDFDDISLDFVQKLVEYLGYEFFHVSHETGGYYKVNQCLGEVTVYNENPEYNYYAIYSDNLKLKILTVKSERHGFLLIEQAIREHGVYDSIVSTDYNGYPTFLSMPKDIQELSDDDLKLEINKEETGE